MPIAVSIFLKPKFVGQTLAPGLAHVFGILIIVCGYLEGTMGVISHKIKWKIGDIRLTTFYAANLSA